MMSMTTQNIQGNKMQKKKINPSVSDTIEHGFRHTWKNLGSMIVLALIYAIIYSATVALTMLGLGDSLSFGEEDNASPEINIFFLASAIIMMIIMSIFMMSIYRGFIITDNQEKVDLSRFFSLNKNIFMGFITIVVSGIVMLIPLGIFLTLSLFYESFESGTPAAIAFIVFAIVEFLLMFYLSYAPFYSLEDGVGPLKAMKRSFEDVSHNPLYILGSIVLMFFISMIGSFFIITIFFIVPMSMVVSAHIYKNISRHRNDDVIENIDRMYSPHMKSVDDSAMKDFNNVMKENNTKNEL